jgi:hypothetical protein
MSRTLAARANTGPGFTAQAYPAMTAPVPTAARSAFALPALPSRKAA